MDGEASTPGAVDSDSRSWIPTRLSGWPSTSVSDAWTCWIGPSGPTGQGCAGAVADRAGPGRRRGAAARLSGSATIGARELTIVRPRSLTNRAPRAVGQGRSRCRQDAQGPAEPGRGAAQRGPQRGRSHTARRLLAATNRLLAGAGRAGQGPSWQPRQGSSRPAGCRPLRQETTARAWRVAATGVMELAGGLARRRRRGGDRRCRVGAIAFAGKVCWPGWAGLAAATRHRRPAANGGRSAG